MHCRVGEPDKTRFRSDRFFTSENQFFFSTREGEDVGPFPNRAEAERGLKVYIDCLKSNSGNVAMAQQRAKQELWASSNCL